MGKQTAGQMSAKYKAGDRRHWITREMADNLVLHHRLSGDTHILNFLSHSILMQLEVAASKADDVANMVRQNLGLTEKDCPDQLIAQCLTELDDAGLIWPVDSVG